MTNFVQLNTTTRFFPADKSVRAYKELFRNDPQLSDEDNDFLMVELYDTTDKAKKIELTNTLMRRNQGLVVSIAKQWANQSNILDLISEGNIGLLTAIRKYRPTYGTKFVTYAALWITSAVRHYIIERDKLMKPANAYRLAIYTQKMKDALWKKNARMPTLEELAGAIEDAYGHKIMDLQDLETFQPCCIDTEMDETACYGKGVEYNDYTNTIEVEDIKTQVDTLLQQLSGRERDIIEGTFGLNNHKIETSKQLASRWNVSRQRVQQIRKDILTKFQQYEENSYFNKRACSVNQEHAFPSV